MLNKDVFQWFFRGFLLTSFVLLAAALATSPRIGWAQGDGNLTAQEQAGDEASFDQGVDLPADQLRPAVDDSGSDSQSNAAALAMGAASTKVQTDLPASELRPVADDSGLLSTSNLGAGGDAPSFAQASDEPADQIGILGYDSPLMIPAAEFSSDGFDPDSFFFDFNDGYVRGGQGPNSCLMAPAYFPDGVTVDDMYASVYDNDGTYNVTVTLWRVYNYSGSTTDVMASVSTSGSNSTIQSLQDATISDPLVIYPSYSYYVTTCLPSSNVRLYSVRIYYTE